MSRADGEVKRKQRENRVTWEKVTKKDSGKEVENAGGHLWLDLKNGISLQMEYGPSRSEDKFLRLCGAKYETAGPWGQVAAFNPSTLYAT